jgi:hypothetical protein
MAKKSAALTARLRHRIPGRTRIRLQAPLPGPDRLDALADQLSALPGVQTVDINPATGSILLHHEPARDPLAAAEEAELIKILPALEPEPFDPTGEILRRIGQIDALVDRASGGRLDAMEVTIAGLVFGGLMQMARGKVAGPALTLFGQAVTLAMARPPRKSAK